MIGTAGHAPGIHRDWTSGIRCHAHAACSTGGWRERVVFAGLDSLSCFGCSGRHHFTRPLEGSRGLGLGLLLLAGLAARGGLGGGARSAGGGGLGLARGGGTRGGRRRRRSGRGRVARGGGGHARDSRRCCVTRARGLFGRGLAGDNRGVGVFLSRQATHCQGMVLPAGCIYCRGTGSSRLPRRNSPINKADPCGLAPMHMGSAHSRGTHRCSRWQRHNVEVVRSILLQQERRWRRRTGAVVMRLVGVGRCCRIFLHMHTRGCTSVTAIPARENMRTKKRVETSSKLDCRKQRTPIVIRRSVETTKDV